MNAAARWLAVLLLVVAPPLFAQEKILRVTFQAAETGFDPVRVTDYYSGKIVGLDALGEQAKKTGKFDYEAPVAGLQTPDRYTLVIRLTEPDVNFQFVMTHALTSAVAHEVIEAYGEESPAHPVGTGPFYLQRYVRSSKIV